MLNICNSIDMTNIQTDLMETFCKVNVRMKLFKITKHPKIKRHIIIKLALTDMVILKTTIISMI